VVEKPCGMSVQEERERDLRSVLASQIESDPGLRAEVDCDPAFGIQPVHRLDRETSGVILLACRSKTFSFFARQFEHHKVRKRYVALLHGELPEPGGEKSWGKWTWPLSKEAGGRLHPEGAGETVPAETRFRILRRSARYTLVECELLTGRKHQIRRHARLAGHAVAGDGRYGTARSVAYLREEKGFSRLALHALSLEIQPPRATAPEVFRSPAVPPEILRLLDEDVPAGRIVPEELRDPGGRP
jgi:23S rRNA-/tRNA-specific pseudouridylate synthase